METERSTKVESNTNDGDREVDQDVPHSPTDVVSDVKSDASMNEVEIDTLNMLMDNYKAITKAAPEPK